MDPLPWNRPCERPVVRRSPCTSRRTMFAFLHGVHNPLDWGCTARSRSPRDRMGPCRRRTPPSSRPQRRPPAPTCGAPSGWRPRRTGSRRPRRSRCSSAAATPSTRPSPGAFVLHVVEPHLNGPGGDLTAVFATAVNDPRRRCWSVRAPPPAARRWSTTAPRASTWSPAPARSPRPSPVRSTPGCCCSATTARGSWPTSSPPRSGTPATATRSRRGGPRRSPPCASCSSEHWPTSADAVAARRHGAGPRGPGRATSARAAVLDRLVEAGAGAGSRTGRIDAARSEWAEGFVAEAIDRFVREPHRHASGTDHAGVIRASDLAAFRASYEPATTAEFRGCTIAKTGPWGQGPALLQALRDARPARRRPARPVDRARRPHDRRGAEARPGRP